MLINCTPHPIDIYRVDRDSILARVQPSGTVVRLREIEGNKGGSLWLDLSQDGVMVDDWDDTENYALAVPCVTRTWADVEPHLPPHGENIYIVPMPVLSALPPRPDVCCPDFGPGGVRNSTGTIIGTRSLVFKRISKGSSKWWRWCGPLGELLSAHPCLRKDQESTSVATTANQPQKGEEDESQ